MEHKINVSMGEYKIATNPTILQIIGLGSCVAVCLYCKSKKVGGMVHITSPDSKDAIKSSTLGIARFADKGIDMLLKRMEKRFGCKKEYIVAKIFGGANMFPRLKSFSLGDDNIKAVKEKLKDLNIKIVSEDVGGTEGRSVWFDVKDGSVVVGRLFGPTKMM